MNVPAPRPARLRRAARPASAAATCLGLAVLGLASGGLAVAGPAAAAAAPALTASAGALASGSTVTFWYSTPRRTLGTSNWIANYSAAQTPGSAAETSWQYALNASGTATFAAASLNGAGSYD